MSNSSRFQPLRVVSAASFYTCTQHLSLVNISQLLPADSQVSIQQASNSLHSLNPFSSPNLSQLSSFFFPAIWKSSLRISVMPRIIMIKRKPLPSSPPRRSTRASASRPLSPSSDEDFDKHMQKISCFTKRCPICNRTLLYRNNALERHIERHAKLAEVKVNLPLFSFTLSAVVSNWFTG